MGHFFVLWYGAHTILYCDIYSIWHTRMIERAEKRLFLKKRSEEKYPIHIHQFLRFHKNTSIEKLSLEVVV